MFRIYIIYSKHSYQLNIFNKFGLEELLIKRKSNDKTITNTIKDHQLDCQHGNVSCMEKIHNQNQRVRRITNTQM